MRKFHSIAALCGDGLRPELGELFERLAIDPNTGLHIRPDGVAQAGPEFRLPNIGTPPHHHNALPGGLFGRIEVGPYQKSCGPLANKSFERGPTRAGRPRQDHRRKQQLQKNRLRVFLSHSVATLRKPGSHDPNGDRSICNHRRPFVGSR